MTGIRQSVEALQALFVSHPDSIRVVNGVFELEDQSGALLSGLSDLGISIDPQRDVLIFNGFVITNVFPLSVIEQRINVNNHEQSFVAIMSDGAIIFENGTLELVGNIDGATYQEVENKLSYLKLYDALRSTDFTDHHNDAQKELILYNSAKGILKIKYTVPFPRFTKGIRSEIEPLLRTLDNSILKIYLKNTLYEFATGNTLTIEELIAEVGDIVSAAKRDQEIATKQFDFDKFRDSLYTQKDKFFTSIRDLLSKIYGQIIGIPISIAASVFTAYKIEHDRFVSALVLISFVLYVSIYVITQKNYYDDIQEIKSDFERDFKDIQSKSGLPEDEVLKERGKISDKIKTATNISLTLIFGMIGLGICAIFFIVNQLISN